MLPTPREEHLLLKTCFPHISLAENPQVYRETEENKVLSVKRASEAAWVLLVLCAMGWMRPETLDVSDRYASPQVSQCLLVPCSVCMIMMLTFTKPPTGGLSISSAL